MISLGIFLKKIAIPLKRSAKTKTAIGILINIVSRISSTGLLFIIVAQDDFFYALCNYLHTHILHHFPQKSRAVCVGIVHTMQPAISALIEILCKTAENFYYDRNFCHKSRKWVEKRAKMSKSGSKNVQKV